jgi:hypothetical protein
MADTINFNADVVEPDLYLDVTDVADPFNINVLIGVSNNHTATLYFKASMDTPPGAYTSYTTNFGALTSGASGFFTQVLTRAAPTLTAGEYDETVTLTISGYTDSGYSTLYATQTLSVDIHHFNHTDASWTITEHANFSSDLNSWTATMYPALGSGLSTTHFYTSPSSCKMTYYYYEYFGAHYSSGTLTKVINTGSKTKARIVFHIYDDGHGTDRAEINVGGVIKKPRTINTPLNYWARLAYNYPVNTAITNTITCYYLSEYDYHYFWVDEIWVISK